MPRGHVDSEPCRNVQATLAATEGCVQVLVENRFEEVRHFSEPGFALAMFPHLMKPTTKSQVRVSPVKKKGKL